MAEIALSQGAFREEFKNGIVVREQPVAETNADRHPVFGHFGNALSELNKLFDEKTKLAGDLASAKKERDAAIEQRNSFEKDWKDVKERLLKEQDKHVATLNKLEQAKRDLERVTGERDDTVKQRDAAIKERDAARTQLSEISKERDNAIRQRDDVTKERDDAIRDRDEFRKQTDQTIADHKLTKEKLLKEQDNHVATLNKLEQAKRDLERVTGERDESGKNLTKEKADHAATRDECDALKQKLAAKIKEHEALTSENKTLQGAVADGKKKIEKLAGEIAAATAAAAAVELAHAKDKAGWDEKYNELERENNRHVEERNAAVVEMEAARKARDEAEEKLKSAISKKEEYERNYRSLVKEYEDFKNKHKNCIPKAGHESCIPKAGHESCIPKSGHEACIPKAGHEDCVPKPAPKTYPQTQAGTSRNGQIYIDAIFYGGERLARNTLCKDKKYANKYVYDIVAETAATKGSFYVGNDMLGGDPCHYKTKWMTVVYRTSPEGAIHSAGAIEYKNATFSW